MQLEAARQEAREHQRRLLQGLGKPIISFENHGCSRAPSTDV